MPKTLKPEKKAHEKKETPKQEPAAKQTPQTKKGRRKPAQPSHHSEEEETKELEELPPLQYSLSDKYSTDNISTDGLTRTAEDVKESKERRDEEMKRVATMRSFWKSKPAEFRDRVRNWQQRELKKRPPNEVMEEGKAKFNLTDEQYSWLLFHPNPSGTHLGMRAGVADPEPPATAEHCFLWRVNRHSFIDPELFLRSSAQTLLVMCFTAFFLSGPPHNEDLLAKILGYHGFLCTVSYSPALYVTPLMFGVFFFFSLRFVLTDIARIQQEYVEKNTLGALVYGLCYISDVIYGLAACAFVLVFVIPVTPATLWQHCLPLLALVLARWMAMFSYMIRFVQPSSGQWFVFMINTVVSFGYVACVTLDLLHPPQAGDEAYISPNITRFFDYAWFGMLFVVYRALPRQPRLETTVGLESFEPPTGVSTATTTEEIPGEPKSIVGKWIDEGETPPFDCTGHNHIWNWEYLNTWTGFRAKMFFCDITTGFLNFGVDQYEDKCMGGFTLLMYWSWLILFNVIFIIPLVLGVVGWILYILYLGFSRLLEMVGLRTVKLSEVYKIELEGAKYPHLSKKDCNDVWVARPVPLSLELDFALYRVPGYLMNLIMSYPIAFARLLSFRAHPPIISDERLNLVGLGSWVAHLLALKDENDHTKGYYMDCHMLRHVDNFEGNYTNAERVNFAACGDVESIVIRKEPAIGINADGTKIFDTVEVKPGDKCWPLAKAHLQGSMITMGLCWAHNWQHFVFPDLAGAAQQRLNPECILAKLLAPHLRFTIRINQVRNHGSAIDNYDKLSYYIRVYILLPMTSSEFLVHNSVKTNVFYYPDNPINNGPRKFELAGSEKMLSQFRIPPFDGVTAAKDAYHYMLYAYYKVIRKFVARVWPNVNPSDWKQWLDFVGPKMPILRVADPIDVLSTLIWTVSVVHSGDHASLGEGRAYWMSAVNRAWNPADAANPRGVFDRWTYCRTQSFFDTYGEFWRNPFLSLRLGETQHDFVETNLIEADEQLRRDLARTNRELHESGCAVLPLEALVECLCF